MRPHSQSKWKAFHANHVVWSDSICSAALARRLSQPCPRHFWPTLGSWLLPQCCTCWARLDAAALCRPGQDCTAACREGLHPPSEDVRNKQANTEKRIYIFHMLVHLCNCFFRVVLWNVPTANDCVLTPTAWCFLPRLRRKSSKEWRSSRWLTAASITSITWEYVQIHIEGVFKAVHTYKQYTCHGHCGEQSSPWWHVPRTLGWRGSLVWSHSLCCSGKDWGAQGPARTVYQRQIPHCSIGVWTWHGLPNIRTNTKSIRKSYIYKSLLPVPDLAAAVSK